MTTYNKQVAGDFFEASTESKDSFKVTSTKENKYELGENESEEDIKNSKLRTQYIQVILSDDTKYIYKISQPVEIVKSEPEVVDDYIILSTDTVILSPDHTSQKIKVTSSVKWEISKK